MSLLWFLQLLSLYVVLSADICDGAVPPCYNNWFGSPCRYQCHCASGTCNKTTGECTEPTTCEKGWFGPSCQYVDLVTTNSPSTPDIMCNPGQDTVLVSLNDTFYFTWLRLRTNVNVTVSSEDFKLQLVSGDNSSVKCSNPPIYMVNDKVIDIHCQTGVFFQHLTITGDGVKNVCSVSISGGRNVALGQRTNQTSTSFSRDSSLAVDGNTDPEWDHVSCTNTGGDKMLPSWTLTFDWPHQINRYVLYNRNILKERLRGFILEGDQQNKSVAFKHTDHSSAGQSIYRIQSTPQIAISSVTITGTQTERYGTFLTLCEVEMFGDTVCPVGQYGRECENKCHCTKDGENCFVSTGVCPSGCAAGYLGESCGTPCNKTYFGPSCSRICSPDCKKQECQPSDGTCLSCDPGKKFPKCNEDCDPRSWGDNCSLSCSAECKDKLCNADNGICKSCPPGKFGQSCEKACNATSYGEGCALACSLNCFEQHCNATNGNCLSCKTGKSGDFCNEACPQKTFGNSCRENCSVNCTSQMCDSVTGKCASCVQGSAGDFCEHMMLVGPPDDDSQPIAVIVGPVVAFVVLVALIVIGVIFWRRRRPNKNIPDQTRPHISPSYEEIDSIRTEAASASTEKQVPAVTGQVKPPVMKKPNGSRDNKDDKTNNDKGVYYNQAPGRSETAIKFNELDNFMATHGKEFFKEQFDRLPSNTSATTTVALSPENVNKNRYKNISAYDHSRVHLQTDVLKNHGDYINASYIDGFRQKKQFIASQGATKINLEDFVRMLWEQETEVVVMLTNLIEEGKLKCEQYWPDDGEITIGEITVKLTTTQVFADYTIRRLCLYKKAPPVQVITHFHFTTWPDKDVPTTAWGLVDLEQRMASIATSKPIVVHCSAGVGRTGTFIALHNILGEIKHTGYMDAFTTVQKLRQDRINMVQTAVQYEFLHKAVQIAMVCKETTVTTHNLRDKIQTLELNESGQSNLEKEFKSVCMVCSEERDETEEEPQENNTYCNSRLFTNRLKNRLDNVLPKEYYRPLLRCETEDMENYINAVLVPNCKKHDHQILTQLPLPTTIIDFWRLVTQYKVTLIVAFERELSTADTTIGDYLPEGEDGTKTCSFLNIKTTGLDSSDKWDVHRITLSVGEEDESKLKNLTFKGEYRLSHLSWKSKDLDTQNLLTLMEKIRSMKPVGEGRTLFTCRNGAELSGLACTMSLLLDRMDNDQHVSVPLVVGTLKAIRPQVIPTLDQYRLLYQTLNLFNETHNEYSNFSKKGSGTSQT